MALALDRAERRGGQGQHATDGKQSRQRFGMRLRYAHWFALAMIAAMAVAIYVAAQAMAEQRRYDATIINVAGKQRMLSQRIAGLATSLVMHRQGGEIFAAARDAGALSRAIETMREDHRAIVEGNAARGLPGLRFDAERALYEAAPMELNRRVARFLDRAVAVRTDRDTNSYALAGLARDARNQLLSRLDQAVRYHEARANAHAAWQEKLETGMLVVVLLALAALGLFVFRPLTRDLHRAEDAIRHQRARLIDQSQRDPLTGLLNRRAMEERFAANGGEAGNAVVVAIDLDRFKEVNDVYGHGAGDEVLRKVAGAMNAAKREHDLAVRLGGDEFILVALPERYDAPLDLDTALTIARRLGAVLHEALSTTQGAVTASLGFALMPDHGTTLDQAVGHADLALYEAKARGRNQIVAYDPALREIGDARRRTEGVIAWGLANDAFEPFFQPQVDVQSGRVLGVEALARCRMEDGSLLPPSEFLDLAEDTGQIVPIGRMVIEKSIAAAAEWTQRGSAFGRLSVNASAAQLADPGFAAFLLHRLKVHGLAPTLLAVEVLETVVLDENADAIRATCQALKARGVTMELDDFGTGYASIANVNTLGVDRIKIDRSIVAAPWTGTNRDLLGAIVSMCRSLDLDVVAEGVENEDHCERLLRLGCNAAQGYHFSRPLAAGAFQDWLDRFCAGLDAVQGPETAALRA